LQTYTDTKLKPTKGHLLTIALIAKHNEHSEESKNPP